LEAKANRCVAANWTAITPIELQNSALPSAATMTFGTSMVDVRQSGQPGATAVAGRENETWENGNLTGSSTGSSGVENGLKINRN
jgi:hypothetical protein